LESSFVNGQSSVQRDLASGWLSLATGRSIGPETCHRLRLTFYAITNLGGQTRASAGWRRAPTG
jgi:hypothetical protein